MAKRTIYSKKKSSDAIFKLRISLPGTDPLVWRQVLVPGSVTLEALHSVFQLTMGWQMCHLYDFQIGKNRFAEPDDFDPSPVKSVATRLNSTLSDHKSFTYTYDFGDDWRHEVSVEEILSRDDRYTYPVCMGGENACPPEDCHGVPGYADLKIETLQWLGGFFDPDSFDPNRINRDMLWMIDWKKDPNEQGLYLPFNFYNRSSKGEVLQ